MIYFHINFVFCVFTFIIKTHVCSNLDGKLKSATIESIVQKICNITLHSLLNKPPEEKALVLNDIEDKLKRSAIGAGSEGHTYVKFIMHGIKSIVFNVIKEANQENVTSFINDDWTTESMFNEINAKEQAVNNIAVKIEALAKKYLKDAKTPESKQAVIDKIKEKVMDAANRRHMMIHSKHKEIKSYSNIIAKGIDLMIKKNVEKDTRRTGAYGDKETHLNIMNTAITPTIASELGKQPAIADCEDYVNQICSGTKTLNIISCGYNKSIPLEKLCNDVPDCVDKSDERNCAEQAIEIIQNAGHIMHQVESAILRNCLSPSLNKEILSEQNQVLRTILKSQLRFIEKYANPPITQLINQRRNGINKNIIKKTVNEVALVVSSLANALDGSICARRLSLYNIEENARRYIGDIDPDEIFSQISKTAPENMKSCVCKGNYCENKTCSDLCERVCGQRYSLDKWSCQSVNESQSVHLDVLCDGKLDCYDESDETGCTLGGYTKFEAGSIYDNILNQISVKLKTREYTFVLPELLMLYDGVKALQKLSIQREVEVLDVKIARDQCFSTINLIYDAFLNQNNIEKLNSGYEFLSSLSRNLMNAMKRSRTGNDKIISENCLCNESSCVMLRCSKQCSRACSVKPQLTRYYCANTKRITNIPINAVCNGKSNCPNGDDKENCSKEVCRSHHLVLLRQKLKDIGLQQKGTALGEVLKAWKTKVISTIQIVEKEDRPTPKVLKDIVSNILQDLVMSYASVEYSRRTSSNNIIQQFVKIAQLVMETIKACGQ